MKSDVALELYDFVVRRPGTPAEKYGLRAYDEVILAPMVRYPFLHLNSTLCPAVFSADVYPYRSSLIHYRLFLSPGL